VHSLWCTGGVTELDAHRVVLEDGVAGHDLRQHAHEHAPQRVLEDEVREAQLGVGAARGPGAGKAVVNTARCFWPSITHLRKEGGGGEGGRGGGRGGEGGGGGGGKREERGEEEKGSCLRVLHNKSTVHSV